MSRSDIPDGAEVIQALKEGHNDEAAHCILEDLQKIEQGPGTPQQKLLKEQTYVEQLHGNALRDSELQRLGFSGFSEIWTHDGQGHRSNPRLTSDTNHNRIFDLQDMQIDLHNTVLGDHLNKQALKARTQVSASGSGELRALMPKEDLSVGERPPLPGTAKKLGGALSGRVDASAEVGEPPVFRLGAQHAFIKSEITEQLPNGQVIDWTKWHHDMVMSAKHEFTELLASSSELRAQAGAYGPTGTIKLQFDVTSDGRIELRGCEGAVLYGGNPNARARFEQIARQTAQRLQHKAGLAFPPGSQRLVNSTELEIGLNSGSSAQWQRNDREHRFR